MPKTSWGPPTIGLGSRDRSTPAPTAKPTMRFRRCNLAAEPASAVGVGVVLSRDVPGTCLPGKDCASDELCLRELCVQSLSACLGVRLCKSPHQTFRTTNIGGDSAQVQTCNNTVKLYRRLTILAVKAAVFQHGNISQRIRPAHNHRF